MDYNKYRALIIQCAKQLTQEARTHHLKQAGSLLWRETNGIIAILDIGAHLYLERGPVLHVNMRLMPRWAADLLREMLHTPESPLITEVCTVFAVDLWNADYPIPNYSTDVLRTLISAQASDFADMLDCITEAEYLSVLSADESGNGTVMRILAALYAGDFADAEALLDQSHDVDDDLYGTDFDACVREYIARKRQ